MAGIGSILIDGQDPNMPALRAFLANLDGRVSGALAQLLAAFVADQSVVLYAARSSLYGNLAPADRSLGIVYNDGNNNGIYIKAGSAGSGTWNATGLMLRGEQGEDGPQGKSFLQTAIDTGYVPVGTTEAAFVAKIAGQITDAATLRAETAAANAAANVAVMTSGPRIAGPLYDTSFASVPTNVRAYIQQRKIRGAIYDPSNLATLWKDQAGTQPAQIGDVVARIDDLSGNGLHMNLYTTTLKRDVNGILHLECNEAGLTVETTQFGSSTYVGVATAQLQRAGSAAVFNLSTDNAKGVLFESLQNGERLNIRYSDDSMSPAFSTGGMLSMPISAAPMGVPATADMQLTPGLATSWVNGCPRSIPLYEYDGGKRAVVTPTTGATVRSNVRLGINYLGNSVSGMRSRFYGAIWIDGAIDPALRASINSWLRWRTGQLGLNNLIYDTFIVTGQSNAQGVGQIEQSPVPLLGQGAYWNEFGYLAQMADPVRNVSDVARWGSAWPRFAQRWYARTGNPCLIVGAAFSGCGILTPGYAGSWQAGGGLVEKTAAHYLDMIASIGGQARLKGMIYAGGEQDVDSLNSDTQIAPYAGLIVDIRNRLRVQINKPALPMFLVSADRTTNPAADVQIARLRQAQVIAGQADAGMKLVVPYQDFVGQGYMTDSVHWSQPALNIVGEKSADGIAAFYGYPAK